MKILKIAGVVLAGLILAGVGAYVWASYAAKRKLSRSYATHTADFPIPFPLSEGRSSDRPAAGAAGEERARTEAFQRGRHLVAARYGCTECHGSGFGGGVMVDDPAIGRILGPNLTRGRGGVTAGFGPADWDRIVRHGIKRDGTPALMPSQDFRRMSDQELSDIIVFLESQPSVDNEVPPPSLGPVGKALLATGKFTLSADLIASHHAPHRASPPQSGLTVEFGGHIAATCTGCHRDDLGGGPIVGGDPAWPPAANLTPGPQGLGAWSYTQFVATMREGKRPDGSALRPPMTTVMPYAQRMTETELQALWSYLRSVPVVADRE
jgi:mono/diheme cytochrome c family protein